MRRSDDNRQNYSEICILDQPLIASGFFYREIALYLVTNKIQIIPEY